MSKITDHQLIGLHILFSFSRSSSSSFSPSFLSLLLLRPSLDWNASATFNLWMNETIFAGSALVAALALVKSFTWYVLNRVRGILDTQLVETIEIKSMTSERYVRVRFNISNRKFNKDRENIFAIQSMECKLPTVCWHIPHIVYSRRRRRCRRQVVWKMSSQHHPHFAHAAYHWERVMLFHVVQNLRSLSVALHVAASNAMFGH